MKCCACGSYPKRMLRCKCGCGQLFCSRECACSGWSGGSARRHRLAPAESAAAAATLVGVIHKCAADDPVIQKIGEAAAMIARPMSDADKPELLGGPIAALLSGFDVLPLSAAAMTAIREAVGAPEPGKSWDAMITPRGLIVRYTGSGSTRYDYMSIRSLPAAELKEIAKAARECWSRAHAIVIEEEPEVKREPAPPPSPVPAPAPAPSPAREMKQSDVDYQLRRMSNALDKTGISVRVFRDWDRLVTSWGRAISEAAAAVDAAMRPTMWAIMAEFLTGMDPLEHFGKYQADMTDPSDPNTKLAMELANINVKEAVRNARQILGAPEPEPEPAPVPAVPEPAPVPAVPATRGISTACGGAKDEKKIMIALVEFITKTKQAPLTREQARAVLGSDVADALADIPIYVATHEEKYAELVLRGGARPWRKQVTPLGLGVHTKMAPEGSPPYDGSKPEHFSKITAADVDGIRDCYDEWHHREIADVVVDGVRVLDLPDKGRASQLLRECAAKALGALRGATWSDAVDPDRASEFMRAGGAEALAGRFREIPPRSVLHRRGSGVCGVDLCVRIRATDDAAGTAWLLAEPLVLVAAHRLLAEAVAKKGEGLVTKATADLLRSNAAAFPPGFAGISPDDMARASENPRLLSIVFPALRRLGVPDPGDGRPAVALPVRPERLPEREKPKEKLEEEGEPPKEPAKRKRRAEKREEEDIEVIWDAEEAEELESSVWRRAMHKFDGYDERIVKKWRSAIRAWIAVGDELSTMIGLLRAKDVVARLDSELNDALGRLVDEAVGSEVKDVDELIGKTDAAFAAVLGLRSGAEGSLSKEVMRLLAVQKAQAAADSAKVTTKENFSTKLRPTLEYISIDAEEIFEDEKKANGEEALKELLYVADPCDYGNSLVQELLRRFTIATRDVRLDIATEEHDTRGDLVKKLSEADKLIAELAKRLAEAEKGMQEEEAKLAIKLQLEKQQKAKDAIEKQLEEHPDLAAMFMKSPIEAERWVTAKLNKRYPEHERYMRETTEALAKQIEKVWRRRDLSERTPRFLSCVIASTTRYLLAKTFMYLRARETMKLNLANMGAKTSESEFMTEKMDALADPQALTLDIDIDQLWAKTVRAFVSEAVRAADAPDVSPLATPGAATRMPADYLRDRRARVVEAAELAARSLLPIAKRERDGILSIARELGKLKAEKVAARKEGDTEKLAKKKAELVHFLEDNDPEAAKDRHWDVSAVLDSCTRFLADLDEVYAEREASTAAEPDKRENFLREAMVRVMIHVAHLYDVAYMTEPSGAIERPVNDILAIGRDGTMAALALALGGAQMEGLPLPAEIRLPEHRTIACVFGPLLKSTPRVVAIMRALSADADAAHREAFGAAMAELASHAGISSIVSGGSAWRAAVLQSPAPLPEATAYLGRVVEVAARLGAAVDGPPALSLPQMAAAAAETARRMFVELARYRTTGEAQLTLRSGPDDPDAFDEIAKGVARSLAARLRAREAAPDAVARPAPLGVASTLAADAAPAARALAAALDNASDGVSAALAFANYNISAYEGSIQDANLEIEGAKTDEERAEPLKRQKTMRKRLRTMRAVVDLCDGVAAAYARADEEARRATAEGTRLTAAEARDLLLLPRVRALNELLLPLYRRARLVSSVYDEAAAAAADVAGKLAAEPELFCCQCIGAIGLTVGWLRGEVDRVTAATQKT